MATNEKIVETQLVVQSYQRINQNITSELLVHYTNTEVLNALFENATFWASNILYLNDSKEFFEGVKIINEVINSNKPTEDNSNVRINDNGIKVEGGIYTISFCAFNDELSQWITYAKESGVAIELDLDLLKYKPEDLTRKNEVCFYFVLESAQKGDNDKEKSEDEKTSYGPQHFCTADVLRKIEYGEKSGNAVQDMMKYNPSQEGGNKEDYRLLASYIKNDNFSIENEIRASFCYNQSSDGSVTKVNYKRLKSGVLRPFIKVQISIRNTSGEFEACLPLKTITVGPSGVQQAVFDSVVHRIKYGKQKIYNYAEKDFQKFSRNFANYLEEVFKFEQENNLISYKGKVAVCERDSETNTGNKVMDLKVIDEEGKDNNDLAEFFKRLICCLNKHIIGKVSIKINGNIISENLTESTKNDDDIKEISKNFYFTEEGVLIKKSKIPYIF